MTLHNDNQLPVREVPSIADLNNIIMLHQDKGAISDGYHTFTELYDHRIANFIALCYVICVSPAFAGMHKVWRSRMQSDGKSYPGWFLLGLTLPDGKQITYHLSESQWNDTWFADHLPIAPKFDGHTSADVLVRLKSISKL